MCRAWLSFAHGLDPNGHGISSVPHWPAYTTDHPTNIVFRADDNQNGTYVELDDYRDSQLAWWNEHWSQLRS
jgi:carboxylesterase type B